MGMYDSISVADRLPVSQAMIDAGFGENTLVYQTKDFHRALDNYIIQGGRLFEAGCCVDSENRSPNDAPYENIKLKELNNYHGVVTFYTHREKGNMSYWIEYAAKFTNGRVDFIELVKFRATDVTERNQRMAEMLVGIELAHQKWYNKYLFHTATWRKVRMVMCSGLYRVARLIYKVRDNLP